MATVEMRLPGGKKLENPNLDFIRSVILRPTVAFWREGNGSAVLKFFTGQSAKTLLVLPSGKSFDALATNGRLYIYLKYIEEDGGTWLSLEDADKLKEVDECEDEWYASVGLFLPPEKAWVAIKEFCESGTRSPQIQWIRPTAIPEGGNW